jgi:hypothetical protein
MVEEFLLRVLRLVAELAEVVPLAAALGVRMQQALLRAEQALPVDWVQRREPASFG